VVKKVNKRCQVEGKIKNFKVIRDKRKKSWETREQFKSCDTSLNTLVDI